MVSRFVADLERPVSRLRLESYRDGGNDLDMVVNYFYNLELSEALYPSLQAFEVASRNSIHLTLGLHFGTPYWFDTSGLYPSPPPRTPVPWQATALKSARDQLTKAGKPHDADRIVAEMHLGFWHALFNRPFEAKLWRPGAWELLGQVFPETTRKERVRQNIWNRIDRIRILRNRVMHFEPIWYRPDLEDDHDAILEAVRWISPAMHQTITMCDRFKDVLDNGRREMHLKVEEELRTRYSG